jgi:hypothetical protein
VRTLRSTPHDPLRRPIVNPRCLGRSVDRCAAVGVRMPAACGLIGRAATVAEMRVEWAEEYAPEPIPDEYGRQLDAGLPQLYHYLDCDVCKKRSQAGRLPVAGMVGPAAQAEQTAQAEDNRGAPARGIGEDRARGEAAARRAEEAGAAGMNQRSRLVAACVWSGRLDVDGSWPYVQDPLWWRLMLWSYCSQDCCWSRYHLLVDAREVSMTQVALNPLQWSMLEHINDVRPINDSDAACLEEIRLVLAKYGNLGRLGIALLHSHFKLSDDEMMLETTDVEQREHWIRPVAKSHLEAAGLRPQSTILRFDESGYSQYCGCYVDKHGPHGSTLDVSRSRSAASCQGIAHPRPLNVPLAITAKSCRKPTAEILGDVAEARATQLTRSVNFGVRRCPAVYPCLGQPRHLYASEHRRRTIETKAVASAKPLGLEADELTAID